MSLGPNMSEQSACQFQMQFCWFQLSFLKTQIFIFTLLKYVYKIVKKGELNARTNDGSAVAGQPDN